MGIKLRCSLERIVCTLRVSLLGQCEAEVVIGAGVVRLQVNGGAKLAYSILGLPKLEQDPAEIRAGLGEIRLDR